MSEQDSKIMVSKKWKKKMKKMEKMIENLHSDRFDNYPIKQKSIVSIDESIVEDGDLNEILINFLDLLLEYQGALSNIKFDLEGEGIVISNYINNNYEGINGYEISIHKDTVGFYGDVFENINSFRIKSNIYNIYYDRLLELLKSSRKREVINGFEKIYEMSNLNRGRSMGILENLDID